MTRSDARDLFRRIRVSEKQGIRAPHKPLLALFMLGRCARGEGRLVEFAAVNDALVALLLQFRKVKRATANMRLPFWFLCNDGVWEVQGAEAYGLKPGVKPKTPADARRWREYFSKSATGGFIPELHGLLSRDRDLVREIANDLLDDHFSATPALRQDILEAVGLSLDLREEKRPEARESDFRQKVLENYGFRCALCKWPGLSISTGAGAGITRGIGLEAAHIRAHSEGGPAIQANGLALCANDHKLFDYGAFTVDKDLVIQVSSKVEEIHPGSERLISLAGERIVTPRADHPAPAYLKWRYEEIFRTPVLQIPHR